MDISFDCGKCGQHIVVDEAGAGLQVQCPKCGERLTVPSSQAELFKVVDECANERIAIGKEVKCFECGSQAEYEHHVIPQSRGGTRTVPLCGDCHAKAHHSNRGMTVRVLTEQALRSKRKRNEKTGGCVPFGYDAVNVGNPEWVRGRLRTTVKLVPNEVEQGLLLKMATMRADGATLKTICDWLESNRFKTKNGTLRWTPGNVRACIERFRREQRERAT